MTQFSFPPITLLIWIFLVCQLSLVWYNVDCSQLMFQFVTINFNWSPQLGSNVQQEISNTKLHKPLLTQLIDHITFSVHCLNLFLCVSTFLQIIEHNMLKVLLFSSIFNIKMAIQKFTNFDKFFFKCMLI